MIIKRSRKEILQLRKENNAIIDKYLEKIYSKIKYAINQYENESDPHKFWEEQLKVIKDLIYECFTKIYSNTSKKLKQIFGQVKEFDVKNIKDLTFNEDGKDLDERIEFYWKQAEECLKAKEIDNQAIKTTLLTKLARIVETDGKVVEETIKKHKQPILLPGQYLIVEVSGCGCGMGGTYPADDYPMPPFHPNCPASAEPIITDDPDDIDDLDLEEEDQE